MPFSRKHQLDRDLQDDNLYRCFLCGTRVVGVSSHRIYVHHGRVIQDSECPWRDLRVPVTDPKEGADP